MKNKNGYSDIAELMIFVIVLAIVTIFGVGYKATECHSKAKKQGFECSYGVLQGCQIKVDGRWIEYSKYRVID